MNFRLFFLLQVNNLIFRVMELQKNYFNLEDNSKVDDAELEAARISSMLGDKKATAKLLLWQLSNDGELTYSALRYAALAVRQGHCVIAYILAQLYYDGMPEGAQQISLKQNKEKAFAYFLKVSYFEAYDYLKELAGDDPCKLKRIKESACTGYLHPVYNEMFLSLVDVAGEDIHKLFGYVDLYHNLLKFSIAKRRSILVTKDSLKMSVSECLSHYTSISVLRSILDLSDIEEGGGESVLRLYNIEYSNDPEEGRFVFNSDVLKVLLPYMDEYDQHNTYVSSFTDSGGDVLNMWRLYGADGEGVSVTIPTKTLYDVGDCLTMSCRALQSFMNSEDLQDVIRNENNFCLYKTYYDSEDIRNELQVYLKAIIDRAKVNGDFDKPEAYSVLMKLFIMSTDEIRFLYKDRGYDIEHEYRLVSYHAIGSSSLRLDERESPKLYVKSKDVFGNGGVITIGPKVKNRLELKLEIEYRLKKLGLRDVKVQYSKVSYR